MTGLKQGLASPSWARNHIQLDSYDTTDFIQNTLTSSRTMTELPWFPQQSLGCPIGHRCHHYQRLIVSAHWHLPDLGLQCFICLLVSKPMLVLEACSCPFVIKCSDHLFLHYRFGSGRMLHIILLASFLMWSYLVHLLTTCKNIISVDCILFHTFGI